MLLINFCGRQYAERYGTQRRPSARAIEKEAYIWVNREIMTVEQAEEHIRAPRMSAAVPSPRSKTPSASAGVSLQRPSRAMFRHGWIWATARTLSPWLTTGR